jgi:hypothetical protein
VNRADVGALLVLALIVAVGGTASYRTLRPVATYVRAAWLARGTASEADDAEDFRGAMPDVDEALARIVRNEPDLQRLDRRVRRRLSR